MSLLQPMPPPSQYYLTSPSGSKGRCKGGRIITHHRTNRDSLKLWRMKEWLSTSNNDKNQKDDKRSGGGGGGSGID